MADPTPQKLEEAKAGIIDIGYALTAPGGVAIRLASYALSAAAIEDQDFLLAHVLDHLGPEHMRRVDQGISIQTEWQMQDGSRRPNTGPISPGADL